MWKTDGVVAHVGPASSGPTQSVQNIYGLDLMSIPQISYSATSSSLSDATVYPLFSRTPPTDALQAKVIKDVLCHYNWNFVCTLAGSDSYSADGIKEFIAAAGQTSSSNGGTCAPLTVVQTASFVTGTASVSAEVALLKSKGCRVVVLFAQGADMKKIFVEAAAQSFTATEAGVVWFASELLNGQYDAVCKASDSADCDVVIKGALMVTPNFGPGTGDTYKALADKWHAQDTKVGTTGGDRTTLTGCDTATDARNKYLWQAQNGATTTDNGACASGATSGCACAAVNFADMDTTNYQAGSVYKAESSSFDGAISTYVPYAYVRTKSSDRSIVRWP